MSQQTINIESGAIVRGKLNTMFGELYAADLTIQTAQAAADLTIQTAQAAADAAVQAFAIQRGNHSGTQAISTVTGLQTALDAKATPADISTAIAALVASSPSTLDTLNELATALGNDPSFATTVSTSIGLKLAKASNLSDLANAATARTNLGVAIGSDVQAFSSVLTTWAGKTAPSGAVVGTTDAQTLTNKRITRRVQSLVDTSVVPDLDNYDCGKLTATQAFTIAAPTGTPTPMQPYLLRITSTAARAITWDTTKYRATDGLTLPTATPVGVGKVYIEWNADDSVYDVLTSF